jgi:hypothetical protein
MSRPPIRTNGIAAGVAAEMFGRAVESVARFPAGRHHFVYDVTLCTALFCLDFLGECGQRFNRAAPDAVDPVYLARLETLLSRFAQCAGG